MAKHIGLIGCSLVVMALLFGAAEARDYMVGDSFGWKIPPNESFYSDWASSKNFFVGDQLVFNLTANQNLADVTKSDYDNCSDDGITFAGDQNGTVFGFTFDRPGPRYFICTVDDHCARGQKFGVNVNEWANSAGPAAQPPYSAPTLTFGALSAFLSSIAFYLFTRI